MITFLFLIIFGVVSSFALTCEDECISYSPGSCSNSACEEYGEEGRLICYFGQVHKLYLRNCYTDSFGDRYCTICRASCYVGCNTVNLDSLNCILSSGNWIPGNPGFCSDYDHCAVYHQQCDQLGGKFTGRQTATGCAASCNTCGNTANKKILEIKVESCCAQDLAPSVERMCMTPDIATGDGMQVSSNANLDCVDPNLDDENLNLYVEYCSDNSPGSSSSEFSSSSGGGGSSGSNDSSSSGGDSDSSGSGLPGDMYDYYPILDTIRDSLVDIKKNVKNIYTCLISPGTCGGLNTKIAIPSDSNFLKEINLTINTTNVLLDSSLKNGNERLKNAIASANDTLIDSLRKFLDNSNDYTVDTLHNIHNSINDLAVNISDRFGYGDTATLNLRDELRGYFTGVEVDTGAVGFANTWVSEGEALGDSLGRAVGWIGGLDSVDIDSVFRASGFDSLSVDSVSGAVDDSLSGVADSLNNILVAQNDSIKRGLPDSLDVWADSLASYSPFASFDSLIFGQLGSKIPNSNECPEDCNKWTIDLPRFGLFNFTVDYGLCLGRVPLGGMNVLGFIRLLLRIVTVWSCIWIVFNALTRRKD